MNRAEEYIKWFYPEGEIFFHISKGEMKMRVVYDDANLPPSEAITKFGPSLTRQSEAKDCDINVIMARYEKTGVLPLEGREAFFADVSEMGDYRTALHQVQMAQEVFMSYPAKLRARFDNDPALFLDFCSNPANRAEMVELGLLEDESGKAPEAAAPVGASEAPGGA